MSAGKLSDGWTRAESRRAEQEGGGGRGILQPWHSHWDPGRPWRRLRERKDSSGSLFCRKQSASSTRGRKVIEPSFVSGWMSVSKYGRRSTVSFTDWNCEERRENWTLKATEIISQQFTFPHWAANVSLNYWRSTKTEASSNVHPHRGGGARVAWLSGSSVCSWIQLNPEMKHHLEPTGTETRRSPERIRLTGGTDLTRITWTVTWRESATNNYYAHRWIWSVKHPRAMRVHRSQFPIKTNNLT